MPKVDSHKTLTRQWEILKLIPSSGAGITSSELTSRLNDLGFTVSKRTVERDLLDLEEVFGLYCNAKSKPYGWKWMDGASADIPSLTLADSVSLYLVETLIRPLLPDAVLHALEPRFNQAKHKLEDMADHNATARWKEKIRIHTPSMPLLPPQMDKEILETLQRALLNDQQLEAVYNSFGSENGKQLRLHPLGLIQRGPVTYLVATAFDYDDIRLYAVHRFTSAEAIPERLKEQKNFVLDNYIGTGALEFGGGKEIKLTALVDRSIAGFLRETPISEDMTLGDEDDWITLKATVIDSWQLRWWILSQTPDIKIISPKGLKTAIRDALATGSALYE